MIVNGQFVDPAPYISEKGGNNTLVSEQLVAYRQWQQEITRATDRSHGSNNNRYPHLQGAEPWSSNPFSLARPPTAYWRPQSAHARAVARDQLFA